MAGLRKEIDRLDVADVVVFAEFGEVAGEGGWVAADVEDARKLGADERVEELAVAAFARWVDDGDVGVVAFAEPFWQPDFRFGGGEMGVAEAVLLSGFLGVVDGLANAVDAVEGLLFVGNKAANGANAAIKIEKDGIRRKVAEHVFAGLIKDFRLRGVDLEEGGRREIVAQAAKAFRNGFAAVQVSIGTAQHEARVGVDVVPDAGDLRPLFGQAFDKTLLAEFLSSGDKDDHHFAAGMAFANHDFVNVGNAGGGDGVFEPGGEAVDLLAEKQAVGGWHQIVAAFFVEAEASGAAGIVGMEDAFVAVAPRLSHGFDGQHLAIQLADALQGVFHLALFDLGLQCRIGYLQGTAAANRCQGARRSDTLRIGHKHLIQDAVNDAFMAVAKGGGNSFFRQSTGYKNDLSFCGAANAAAVVRKAGDMKLGHRENPPRL